MSAARGLVTPTRDLVLSGADYVIGGGTVVLVVLGFVAVVWALVKAASGDWDPRQ